MKVKRLVILSFFTLGFLLNGCQEEDVFNYFNIDEVSGLKLNDIVGNSMSNAGDPNEYCPDILCYPVPCIDYVILSITQPVKRVWVIRGQLSYNNHQFQVKEMDRQQVVQILDHKKIYSFEVGSGSIHSINVDLSEYKPGLFRIFCQMKNGDIQWVNACKIDPNEINSFEALMSVW